MPNPNYIAGANFERRVKNWLHKWGYPVVIRSAGSKGPADLVAVIDGVAWLIQCTTSMESKNAEYQERFRQWAAKGRGAAVFAWQEYKGGPIHFCRADLKRTDSLPWYHFIDKQRGWKHDDFTDD